MSYNNILTTTIFNQWMKLFFEAHPFINKMMVVLDD